MTGIAEKQLAQAIYFHQKGRLDLAEEAYKQLIIEDPDNPDIHHFLGTLYAQQGLWQQAMTSIKTAQTLAPENVYILSALGNCHKALDRQDQAQACYQKAILIQPNYAAGYNNLGTIYQKKGNIDQAQHCYRQAIIHAPYYAEPHYNLGLCTLQQKAWDKALDAFQQCLALDPTHPKAHLQMGICRLQQNQFRQALPLLEKQILLDPNCIEAHYQLGNCFHAIEAFHEAAKCYERVITLQPEHEQANYNTGTCYLALNDFARALPHFMFLMQKKRPLDVLFNVAIIYMRQDKHQDAITYFEEILSQDNNHIPARTNLASTYIGMKDYKNAKKQYRQLLKLDPENVQYQFTLQGLEQSISPKQAPTSFIKDLFNQYADHYDKHLREFLHYNVPQQLFQRYELHGEKPITRALDLGCGTGLCGEWFAPISSHLTGIDMSEKMIEAAREKGCYDTLEKTDAFTALRKYPNNQVIIAADVLPYVGELDDLFIAIADNLMQGGLWLFSCEICHNQTYHLQQTLRYAHSKIYIEKVLKNAKLELIEDINCVLRQQHNKPLEGRLYVAKK